MRTTEEGVYEYVTDAYNNPKEQLCPVCKGIMGLMPGTRDAICHNCGYKDPCCE